MMRNTRNLTSLTALSTALPEGVMSQKSIARLSQARCTHSETASTDQLPIGNHNGTQTAHTLSRADAIQMKRLFRNACVDRRHLVVAPKGPDDHQTPLFYAKPHRPGDRGPSTGCRMARYEEDAAPLALRACRESIAHGVVSPDAVTHVITVSCTGFAAPGIDIQLIESLGLRSDVARTHIGFMGCHGFLVGLRSIDAICQSSPDAVALMCAVELCSLHFQYSSRVNQLVANALFADGAAALIATADPRTLGDWRITDTTSMFIPGTQDAMTWHVGDHGFVMNLVPNVPQLIAQSLQPWLSDWLGRSDLRVEDIAGWAVHPGGPKILDAVQATLNLPDGALEPSRQVLRTCGNMSSPTVAFILNRLATEVHDGPCVMLAFGPGLTIEATLLGRCMHNHSS